MKPLQLLILVLAAVWIVVKLLLFYSGNAVSMTQVVVSLNIGFTLFVIFKALKIYYKESNNSPSDFLKDFIVSMKAASQYSLIIFGFLAIYYIYIDTQFLNELVDTRIIELKEKMASEGGFDAVMEKYKDEISLPEGSEDISEVEYYEEVRTNYTQMLNTKMVLTVIFMGLFFLNLACSAIFSAVYKKFFIQSK